MTMKAALSRIRRVEKAVAGPETTDLILTIDTIPDHPPINVAEVGPHRFRRHPGEAEDAFRVRALAVLPEQDGPLRFALFLHEPETNEAPECA